MSIDKNTLDIARKWADHITAGDDLLPQEAIDAAAEVIQALPDEFIDADKLRELIDRYREYSENHDEFRILSNAAIDLQALIPTPDPRVEIRMGAWAQHPEHGRVMIVSAKPNDLGSVLIAWDHGGDNTGTAWTSHTDLSPLPDDEDDDPEEEQVITYQHLRERYGDRNKHTLDWLTEHYAPGGIIAPAGEDDEPADEPEFDSARMYYDQDGDVWASNPGVGGWVHFDATDRGYSVPPAEYGPYTRIEKGDS